MQPKSIHPIRTILADSCDLVLVGARIILQQNSDYEVLGTVRDFRSLFNATRENQPDVIVFDDQLDPDIDLWCQIDQLRLATASRTRFILSSNRISGSLIGNFLAHGIHGVLYKRDELEICLHHAILAVIRNRLYLSPTANAQYLTVMQSSRRNKRLDPEAHRVLQLLSQGEHIGRIGERLGIDKRRVYWVREKLRQRFDAKTNEHLIQRAVAEGFIHPQD